MGRTQEKTYGGAKTYPSRIRNHVPDFKIAPSRVALRVFQPHAEQQGANRRGEDKPPPLVQCGQESKYGISGEMLELIAELETAKKLHRKGTSREQRTDNHDQDAEEPDGAHELAHPSGRQHCLSVPPFFVVLAFSGPARLFSSPP